MSTRTTISTYIVDSFTDTPFKGNPAGVCLLDAPLSDAIMLAIAQELGLSETAYVAKQGDTDIYSIRYFSPKMEIPLCGHATLAAAAVLYEVHPEQTAIHFQNIQALDLIIDRDQDWITMHFPIYETTPQSAPPTLLAALGLDTIRHSVYNAETNILLLEIEDSEVLRRLTPDFVALRQSHDSINGVLVTAPSQSADYDIASRYFWPWSGTDEDPVTGATHTFLAKYWADRLHKTHLRSYQCSERSGYMEVTLLDDQHLMIKGKAQIVLEGSMRL